MLAQASRLNFSTRLFNLIVTNVPGPQFPLYVRGREWWRLSRRLPAKDHALAIAIIAYDGQVNFGLLGDYDALDDIRRGRRDPGCRSASARLARAPARAEVTAPPRAAALGRVAR